MSRSYKRLLSAAGKRFFVRTVGALTTDQKEKEPTENKIEPGETNQRENGVAVGHHFTVAVARVKKAVDQPWLTSQFGRHPAQCVSDVRKGKRQHQHPEQHGAGFQLATPILEAGISHKENEDRAQRDHYVKRVIQKFDVVGPCILGIFLQSVNITLKGAVGEKTECAGNLDGILEPPASNIGLPDNGDTRNGSAHESAFHCSGRYRLLSANHHGLLIAVREGNT